MADLSNLAYPQTMVLWNFLRQQDLVPPEADAIIVLGGSSISIPDRALSLMLDDGVKTSIVAFCSAGGVFGGNLIFGMSEVNAYKKHLLDGLVEKTLLLYPVDPEHWTTNTLAEARALIPFIDAKLGRHAENIILCAHAPHMRRVANTFRKQWPMVQFYCAPSFDQPSVEMLLRMLQEVARLKIYGDKGDILPTEFPEDVLGVCRQLLALPEMEGRLTETELLAIKTLLD